MSAFLDVKICTMFICFIFILDAIVKGIFVYKMVNVGWIFVNFDKLINDSVNTQNVFLMPCVRVYVCYPRPRMIYIVCIA